MPVSTAGLLGLQALYVSGAQSSHFFFFAEGHSSPQYPHMLIVLRPTFELLIDGSS
jgi:hypothetical protein